MEEKSSTKIIKVMTESKENKITEKGLISPEKANKSVKKETKKIRIGKNDIVERDNTIINTDDGRQLLK